MTVINTNIKSLITQTALARNARDLQTAMNQLATGKRINSAADDAAGLTIASSFRGQIKSLGQEVRNANDGVSLLQTAEGSTEQVTQMLQRMRELAIQARNGTNSPENTDALQKEFDQLQEEIVRISTNTEWNGMKVLGDDASTFAMQIGANADQSLDITFDDISTTEPMASAVDSISIQDSDTLGFIDEAIDYIDSFRSGLGAKINRLEYTVDNLTNISVNTSASRSRILDADYAKAASEMARTQIIQQAGTSILAQANTDQQTVLQLLKG